MKFAVITQIEHFKSENRFFSYAPYVREMNLWFQHVEEVVIVAPISAGKSGKIDDAYQHLDIDFKEIPAINFTSVYQIFRALLKLPLIVITIFKVMKSADHIHLRCPGNVGLLGSIVQIFFPKKSKTAKYAGNWDPESKQPWSYKLQKWILGNTVLTKNMQVLVYGQWPNQSKNIKPFFTASYTETEKKELPYRKYDLPLRFLFVGSLVKGKQPKYVIELIEGLVENEFPCELHFYGDGMLREALEEYLTDSKLKSCIYFHGNQETEQVKEAYQKSHFLVLPSKSEGWPKVVAEAMWWGTLPLVTSVSCVPWMLGNKERGLLLSGNLTDDIKSCILLLKDKEWLRMMAEAASEWSRYYTLNRFDSEIKKLL